MANDSNKVEVFRIVEALADLAAKDDRKTAGPIREQLVRFMVAVPEKDRPLRDAIDDLNIGADISGFQTLTAVCLFPWTPAVAQDFDDMLNQLLRQQRIELRQQFEDRQRQRQLDQQEQSYVITSAVGVLILQCADFFAAVGPL